jgi:F420-non-reducing hydrogenase large subunit
MSDQHEGLEGAWQEGAQRAGTAYARRRISIDPVTRLEGHGKIDIFLDQAGEVERAYFQVPELRGFEKFVQGRPAEEMPQITSRICGVCPTAHHMPRTPLLLSGWPRLRRRAYRSGG